MATYTTRIPGWTSGPVPGIRTLRDAGVLSHDCPFCPEQYSGAHFAANEALRELLAHYLVHRTDHMQAESQPPCPCCGKALRPSYASPSHLWFISNELLLRLELAHFLCGSLGVPADKTGSIVAEAWPWLEEQFGFDEQGRLQFQPSTPAEN